METLRNRREFLAEVREREQSLISQIDPSTKNIPFELARDLYNISLELMINDDREGPALFNSTIAGRSWRVYFSIFMHGFLNGYDRKTFSEIAEECFDSRFNIYFNPETKNPEYVSLDDLQEVITREQLALNGGAQPRFALTNEI